MAQLWGMWHSCVAQRGSAGIGRGIKIKIRIKIKIERGIERRLWNGLGFDRLGVVRCGATGGEKQVAVARENEARAELQQAMSKILVIDDESAFRQVLMKYLDRQGFEVVGASGGAEGVGLAAATLPDLVVCDLTMPQMDGYQVLAAMHNNPALADIPVIFLTALSAPDQVRHGMSLGADDYLTKPVNLTDLLNAIHARLNRRKAARERQEKQMERAMRLFAGIVHDLRDPLFVMLGYTDMLRQRPEEPARPVPMEGGEILDRMQQAVLKMQEIVAETLFLTRARMQRLPFNPGPLDVREFCEQILLDHGARERLRFQCPVEHLPVNADAVCLRQALDNLVGNALKYSNGPVQVSVAAEGTNYVIEVKDAGIGIPREEQAAIFEPFFRASNTADKPGHGLGLSIVKSCVECHGGTIRFHSAVNQGTTFCMELPMSPALAEDAPQALAPEGGLRVSPAPVGAPVPDGEPEGFVSAGSGDGDGEKPGKLRGILVDDDPLVRSLLRDLLQLSNDVTILGEAETVAQARLLAQRGDVQVVFLDVNLPDGSGFDLLAELEEEVAVVFVTSAEEYAVHAFDCEAADFLLKPVTPERLQKAVQRVRERLATQAAHRERTKLEDTFLVKTLTDKRVVKVGEIRRIEAYGEYSRVFWEKDRPGALLRKSLKQWLSNLPENQFVRVHRQAIVNLAFLERVEKLPQGGAQVRLKDTPQPIPVSLRLAPGLNRKLKAFRA